MEYRTLASVFLTRVVLLEDQHLVRRHSWKVVPALTAVMDQTAIDQTSSRLGAPQAISINDVIVGNGGDIAQRQRHQFDLMSGMRPAPDVEQGEVVLLRHIRDILNKGGEVSVDHKGIEARACGTYHLPCAELVLHSPGGKTPGGSLDQIRAMLVITGRYQ